MVACLVMEKKMGMVVVRGVVIRSFNSDGEGSVQIRLRGDGWWCLRPYPGSTEVGRRFGNEEDG